MLSYLLIALFVVVGLAAATSLADGVVRFANAWHLLQREAARSSALPRTTSTAMPGGVVVVLRKPATAQVSSPAIFAAAA